MTKEPKTNLIPRRELFKKFGAVVLGTWAAWGLSACTEKSCLNTTTKKGAMEEAYLILLDKRIIEPHDLFAFNFKPGEDQQALLNNNLLAYPGKLEGKDATILKIPWKYLDKKGNPTDTMAEIPKTMVSFEKMDDPNFKPKVRLMFMMEDLIEKDPKCKEPNVYRPFQSDEPMEYVRKARHWIIFLSPKDYDLLPPDWKALQPPIPLPKIPAPRLPGSMA